VLSAKYEITIKIHHSYNVECHQSSYTNGHDQYKTKVKHK